MTESERLYAELLDKVIDIDRQTNRAVSRELQSLQTEIMLILDHYTRADGTINRTRVDALLRDIQSVEQMHYDTLLNGIVGGMSVAVAAVATFLVANEFVNGVQRKLNAMTAIAAVSWLGGMSLMDRVRITSGDYGDKIRTVVRNGIMRQQDQVDILKAVKGVHKTEQWKINRLITSEINNAYRMQFATTANANGDEYVQFYESQLCTHPNHERHRCHTLAHEDRYGKGDGVFRWDDVEIYAPHPQCRGFIGRYIEGGDANADG